jgi:hypothetical protein
MIVAVSAAKHLLTLGGVVGQAWELIEGVDVDIVIITVVELHVCTFGIVSRGEVLACSTRVGMGVGIYLFDVARKMAFSVTAGLDVRTEELSRLVIALAERQ